MSGHFCHKVLHFHAIKYFLCQFPYVNQITYLLILSQNIDLFPGVLQLLSPTSQNQIASLPLITLLYPFFYTHTQYYLAVFYNQYHNPILPTL